MAGWIKMSLDMEVDLGPGDCVRLCVSGRGPSSRPRKGGGAPEILVHVYCGQTARWMKMALGKEVGLDPSHIVLDGDPAPLPKRGQSPLPFSAHVYCGQTARWIKMPLGTETDLGPGDFVLDGDPAPRPQKGAETLNFRPMSIVAKRLHASKYHLVWS